MPYDTEEEISALSKIDQEFEAFLMQADLPRPDYHNPEVLDAIKKDFAQLTAQGMEALGPPPPSIKLTETSYTTSDGHKNRARLFQPTEFPSSGSPLIVMIHSGGFCSGAPEVEEQSCRNFVQAYGATCVSIAYRLGPEHPFPHAPKDCWNGVKWAAAHAKAWGADPSVGFVVGGASAGGNLTAVVVHLARDEGLSPPLTGQYLAIPMVGTKSKMPERYRKYFLSYEQNRDAPNLSVAAIDMFMIGYKPDENDGVLFAVLKHPKGHGNLPPTFFQIAGLDPLRDEGLIY